MFLSRIFYQSFFLFDIIKMSINILLILILYEKNNYKYIIHNLTYGKKWISIYDILWFIDNQSLFIKIFKSDIQTYIFLIFYYNSFSLYIKIILFYSLLLFWIFNMKIYNWDFCIKQKQTNCEIYLTKRKN